MAAKVRNVATVPAEARAAQVNVVEVDSQQTPTQATVASRTKTATVVDARGRTLVLRSLNALEYMRLTRILGPDNARNEPYAAMAMSTAIVRQIDEEKYLSIPNSIMQLEAKFALLDSEGAEAVSKVARQWAEEEMRSVEQLVEAAKN